jgi:hypothetical protein
LLSVLKDAFMIKRSDLLMGKVGNIERGRLLAPPQKAQN